jgi:hypothetical protein
MKYGVETAQMSSFIKIGLGFQKLRGFTEPQKAS